MWSICIAAYKQTQMQIDFSTPELPPPPFTRGIVIINVQLLYNTDQIDKNVQLS